MVIFTALTKFTDNQEPHVVEIEFFEIFLRYSFRLIGPQTKQGNMHPCSAKTGLSFIQWRCWILIIATNDVPQY
jgi:hypothetical protein